MNRTRLRPIGAWLIAACLAAASPGHAAVTVTADLNRNTIRVGESAVLTIKIQTDAGEAVNSVEFPHTDSLEYVNAGQSQGNSITVSMGKVTQVYQLTLQYEVIGLKPGKYDLSQLRVPYNNSHAQAAVGSLTVLEGSQQAAPVQGDAKQRAQVNPYNIVMAAEQSQEEVYVGEMLQLTYVAYFPVTVQRLQLDDHSGQFQNFWTESLDMMSEKYQQQIVHEGKRYLKVPLRRYFLFPLTAGEHAIDPVSLKCEVLTGPVNPFFNRGGKSVDVTSPTVPIRVKPLPEAGKPAFFNGAVGQFRLDAGVDASEVEEGEPITLTITLSGVGNIRNAPKPVLPDLSKFSMFDPTTEPNISVAEEGVGGEMIYTHVLIPQDITANKIEPVRYAYFDPATEQYVSLETPEIALTIKASARGNYSGIAGGESNRRILTRLSDDFRFIAVTPDALSTVQMAAHQRAGFWLAAAFPLVLLGGALALKRRRDFIALNPEIAKSKKAPRLAVKFLADARESLNARDSLKTYSALSKALTDFINHRWNLSCAGLTSDELRKTLSDCGIEPDCVERVALILQDFDGARFSCAPNDFQTMQRDYGRAQQVIADLMKQKA